MTAIINVLWVACRILPGSNAPFCLRLSDSDVVQHSSSRELPRVLVGWLVIEVEQLFNVLKQWTTAVPARALSRTNHINAAHLSSSSSWVFPIYVYTMLLSSYLCLRVVQRMRCPMCTISKKSQSNLRYEISVSEHYVLHGSYQADSSSRDGVVGSGGGEDVGS